MDEQPDILTDRLPVMQNKFSAIVSIFYFPACNELNRP